MIYAVVRFRMIIGKYGLVKRVNYRMFIINAVAMGLYTLVMFSWYGNYIYCVKDNYCEG
jgi:putative exporter of polyketide antibiotics